MAEEKGAVLIVERGAEPGKVILVDRDAVTIGRLASNEIFIDDPYISRRHAQIRLKGEQFFLTDLGSKNGTFLNSQRVAAEPRPLHSGDEITLGLDRVALRFKQWGTTLTFPGTAPDEATPTVAVDGRAREVFINTKKLAPPLARKEFDLLWFLYQRRGTACSKDEIAAAVWPEREGGDVGDYEIEQCVHRLRVRIESDPSQPHHVITVRGYGYKLT